MAYTVLTIGIVLDIPILVSESNKGSSAYFVGEISVNITMNAAVIVGLSVLLISGGHCKPEVPSSALQGALEEVQFLTTNLISGGHCKPEVPSSALQGALEEVQFLTTNSGEYP